MQRFLEHIGSKAVAGYKTFKEILVFSVLVLFLLFDPKSYDKSTKRVLIRQIYFTAVQVLGYFVAISLFFGAMIVGISTGVLRDMGLLGSLGGEFFQLFIVEIAPLFTVVFLALRSSSAINAEIAVMKVNGELDSLAAFGIDPYRYLAIPRIVNGMVSVTLLSFLFAILSIVAGSLVSLLFFGTNFVAYSFMVAHNIELLLFAELLIKSLVLGFAVIIIPIYSGINSQKQLTAVPISVLKGMVRVFNIIIFVEVVSLALKLI